MYRKAKQDTKKDKATTKYTNLIEGALRLGPEYGFGKLQVVPDFLDVIQITQIGHRRGRGLQLELLARHRDLCARFVVVDELLGSASGSAKNPDAANVSRTATSSE